MRKYLKKLPPYTKATKEAIKHVMRTRKEIFLDWLIDYLIKIRKGGDSTL